MEYSEEVQKLAETLKNSGLAASMEDALKRAESMIGKKEESFEKSEDAVEKPVDTAQTTLGNTKEPKKAVIEESPELEEGLKKEEVFTNKTENTNKEKSENQKNADSNDKKVDLTKIFNVNK